MSESNNLDINQLLDNLAELLAHKLEDKRNDHQDLVVRLDELFERVVDLEDKLSDENFSEDDVRDWISEAINSATITIES